MLGFKRIVLGFFMFFLLFVLEGVVCIFFTRMDGMFKFFN